jgi:hypothetical protein|tara:strand:- start:7685 stop:7960 length:276 start_codon:yes stop_codon:yes gene_type:complete
MAVALFCLRSEMNLLGVLLGAATIFALISIFNIGIITAAVSGLVVLLVVSYLFKTKKHTVIQEGTQIVSSVEHNKDNMGSEPSPFGGVRSE